MTLFSADNAEFAIALFNQIYKHSRCLKYVTLFIILVHSFPGVLMCRVKGHYLAMVLPFVLQHLLQVQAAGQVALCQVVAELRDAEQTLLPAHCFTVCKQEHT